MLSQMVTSKGYCLIGLCLVSIATGILNVITKGYPGIPSFHVWISFGLNLLFVFMWFRHDTVARQYLPAMVLQAGVIILPFIALPVYFFTSRGVAGGFKALGKMTLFFILLGGFNFMGWTGTTVIMANLGTASAQNDLGIMYAKGVGVRQNDEKAVTWFHRAAEQEFPTAHYHLGVMYANSRGVPRDYRAAVRCYRKAAEKGNADARMNLGIMYAKGQGVRQDYAAALKWFSQRPNQNDNGCLNCQAWLLATCPDQGIRNGPLAVLMAGELVAKNPSVHHLDTLAAAYAEAGRFQDAIHTQQKVLRRVTPGTPSHEKYRKRLKAYQNRSPWREN